MIHRKGIQKIVAAVSCLLLAASASLAQDYPSRAIRIVVPAPAGGPTDVLARLIGQKLTDAWSQPVVIENRAGANQIIGTEAVAKAAPDGYTFLMAVDSTLTMHPHAYKKLPYDAQKDFAPVTTVANSWIAVMTNAASPAKSLREVLALAKASPGKLSYGSGTLTTQVIAERVSQLAGVKFLYVPYKGSAPTFAALLAGDINLSFDGFAPYRGAVGQGKIRVLAVTGDKRASALPDVPTLGELGFPGLSIGVWLGVVAPAGTPSAIVNRMSQQINQAITRGDLPEKFAAMGLEPMPSNPEKMAAFIRAESDKWSKVIKDAGITLE